MNDMESLGMESLTLAKAQEDYKQRRAVKRKTAKEDMTPDAVKTKIKRKKSKFRGSAPSASEQASCFAAPNERPMYTPPEIPPLGSSAAVQSQVMAGLSSELKIPHPLQEDLPSASTSRPGTQIQPIAGHYPCLSRAKAKMYSQGIADFVPTTTTAFPPTSVTAFAPIRARPATPISAHTVVAGQAKQQVTQKTLHSHVPVYYQPPKFPTQPLLIPDPTRAYLTQASRPALPLSHPQHLLLVVDLNGTLLFRRKGSKAYHPRPSLQPFLAYCFANHSLLIWSSATPGNVQGVCATLFTSSERSRLLGEWGRDTLGLTAAQYREKVQVYKRLGTVWADEGLQARHPGAASGERWSQANTVLIDDSVDKAMGEPWNLVQVPEFVKYGRGEKQDVLGQVVGWLEEARGWSDVSAFSMVMGSAFQVDGGWGRNWKGRSGKGAAAIVGEGVNHPQCVDEDLDEDDDGGVKI